MADLFPKKCVVLFNQVRHCAGHKTCNYQETNEDVEGGKQFHRLSGERDVPISNGGDNLNHDIHCSDRPPALNDTANPNPYCKPRCCNEAYKRPFGTMAITYLSRQSTES